MKVKLTQFKKTQTIACKVLLEVKNNKIIINK